MQINQKYIKIYPNKSTIIQFISLKNVLPRVKELIKDNNKNAELIISQNSILCGTSILSFYCMFIIKHDKEH